MCQVNEASLTLDKLQSSRGNVNSVVRGRRLSSLVRVAVKREWTMLLIIEFSTSGVRFNGINCITRLCSPACHVGFNSLADEVKC